MTLPEIIALPGREHGVISCGLSWYEPMIVEPIGIEKADIFRFFEGGTSTRSDTGQFFSRPKTHHDSVLRVLLDGSFPDGISSS